MANPAGVPYVPYVSALAKVLREERAELLEAWRHRLREPPPTDRPPSYTDLERSRHRLVDEVLRALEGSPGDQLEKCARDHVARWVSSTSDLLAFVEELQALFTTALECAERHGHQGTPKDARDLHETVERACLELP